MFCIVNVRFMLFYTHYLIILFWVKGHQIKEAYGIGSSCLDSPPWALLCRSLTKLSDCALVCLRLKLPLPQSLLLPSSARDELEGGRCNDWTSKVPHWAPSPEMPPVCSGVFIPPWHLCCPPPGVSIDPPEQLLPFCLSKLSQEQVF